MFCIYSFIRGTCVHSGLKDSMCYPSTVWFFQVQEFYPFQFIPVISSGSWICIQMYQNLSSGIFFRFAFLSFSIVSLASLISLLDIWGLYTGECEVQLSMSSVCVQKRSFCWVRLGSLVPQQVWVCPLNAESKCIPEEEPCHKE